MKKKIISMGIFRILEWIYIKLLVNIHNLNGEDLLKNYQDTHEIYYIFSFMRITKIKCNEDLN